MQSLSEKLTLLNIAALESIQGGSELEIIQQFTQRAIDILGADFGHAWFKSPGANRFQLAYHSPNAPYIPEYPRKNGTTHEAIQAKAPILIDDVPKRKNAKSDAKSFMASAAIVPITYRNNTYGIFVLAYTTKHIFTPAERDLATAIGNSAAQAITINRLYSDLKDFKNTLDNTLDGIFIIDPKNRKIVYSNTGAVALTELKRSAIERKLFYEIIVGLKPDEFQSKMDEIADNPKLQYLVFESWLQNNSGVKVPVEISLQHVVQKNQPERFLAIVRDIRERKQSEEIIRRMAYYDPLTGLPNRSLFAERVQTEHDRAESSKGMYGLYFVDLDRFKVINDIYGHQVGDALLRQVGARLSKAFLKKATISRMGGDEFMILVPKLKNPQEAIKYGKAVQEAFVEFFIVNEQEIYVNCSVGVAIYPLDGLDQTTMFKHADLALHRAKEQGGRNFQQYNVGLSQFYSMQPKLEGQLRQAIKRNELLLHYQPVVSTRTKHVIGSEALVRWNHPEMGILYPDAFIGPAEESGLIVDIGEWVFREVCRQIQEWHAQGRHVLPVSINVSPRELLRPTFAERIEQAMKEFKVKPGDLKIELTETFLIKNIDLSVGILEQLKLLGLKILIDDFGTGYASLNYLKRMPIDGVKIDRTFIQGLGSDLQDAALTSAIISIAHQLGLEVVAEGVELQQQYDMLKEQKCNSIQGNYFYKPLAAEALTELLKKAKN